MNTSNKFTQDGCDFTFDATGTISGAHIYVFDANGEQVGDAELNHQWETITYTTGESTGDLNYWDYCDTLDSAAQLAIAQWIAGTYWQ